MGFPNVYGLVPPGEGARQVLEGRNEKQTRFCCRTPQDGRSHARWRSLSQWRARIPIIPNRFSLRVPLKYGRSLGTCAHRPTRVTVQYGRNFKEPGPECGISQYSRHDFG
jgi:hypothetical protein